MKYLSVTLLLILISAATHADTSGKGRADSHAPIGVMGDHVHKKGDFMASYRYMTMNMKGNVDGSSSLNTAEVLNQYMVAPLEMTMDMHMFGLMYAPSNSLTLMIMLPLLNVEMDHVTRMGAEFTTKTDGLGDVTIAGLFKLYNKEGTNVHLNLGVSVPTGSITEKGDTPMGNDVKLPYPMQLGSGTFDFLPGITYYTLADHWSWGAQAKFTLRLDTNDEDYTLGDRKMVTAWAAYQISPIVSISLRVEHQDWDEINGADPELNPMMVPTADPTLRGGNRTEAGLGANILIPSGALAGHRIAFEYLTGIAQNLDGPQLETEDRFIAGWQLAF